MRAAGAMAACAILLPGLLSGCARERSAQPAPEVVAIKVAPADMARYRAMAQACGAASSRIESVGDATLLVVGKADGAAARDCFYARSVADYRAAHPVRAWIEGVIG